MFTNFFKSIGVGTRTYELPAPLAGHVIPLAAVKDDAFASGALGRGLAIQPTGNRVVAPSAGKVESVFPTGHAIALHTTEGLHILIHLGIDTLEDAGSSFTVHVAEGDSVRQGDVLIEFDLDALQTAGFDMTAPIIICNSAEYASIKTAGAHDVRELDALLAVRAR